VGVKVEADRKVVGGEVVAAVETDSKYLGLMQSQRKKALQRMSDSHNPVDVLIYLRKGNGILWQIL
jgi:hypothetical protein